jgi:hypothetical protein
MYIPPFIAGVAVTLFVEIVLIFVASIIRGGKDE